ncbi:MAG: hypothetical protein HYY40_02295 [Bacteroidetes bacterium]|nr:hypothetical protein [Bacteroidota bacterium]
MKKIIPLLSLGLLSAVDSYSQNPIISWQKSYGGSSYEGAYLIRQTTDNGYIVCGYNWSTDKDVHGHHGSSGWAADGWVVKLDAAGDTAWTISLGGTSDDYANAVAETPDGGFIVVLQSYSNNGDLTVNYGGTDYWLVKLTAIGQIQWKKSLNGTSYDVPLSVVVNSNHTFAVTGYSGSSNADFPANKGYEDVWVHKFDSTGSIIWKKNYGGTDTDEGWYIDKTFDGGYVIAGNSWSNDGDVSGNHGYNDCWVFRIDSVGTLLWQKSLGGSYREYGNAVQQTTDGGFIVGAMSWSDDGDVDTNKGGYDYWLIKLDGSGNIQWQKSYGSTYHDYCNSVIQSSDGGYFAAGYSGFGDADVGVSLGMEDFWILKLDNSGAVQWKEVLGGDSLDYAFSAIHTNDGGYAIAGITRSFDNDVTENNGEADLWVAKIQCNPPFTPSICLVTVDSASQKNLIVWEKTGLTGYIESFNVYKEGSFAGVYNLIVNSPVTSISEYLDIASDPKTKANRYKLSTVDTCGFESPLSSEHKTMHLTVNKGGINNEINLIWENYEGFSFGTYLIYAGSLSQFDSVDAIANTLTSYSIWPPYDSTWNDFFVAVVHPAGCTSTKMLKSYNSSKSNTASLSVNPGIERRNSVNGLINIFPNPLTEQSVIIVDIPMPAKVIVSIDNLIGQNIMTLEPESYTINGKYLIKAGHLKKALIAGIYCVRVTFDGGVYNAVKLSVIR